MRLPCAGCLTLLLSIAPSAAAQDDPPFVPEVGQPGKDVVWVPTPPELVERMLDVAEVGPGDLLMDLGSGDGRIVIAAAKRGARAIGVEYSINMTGLARRNAEEAGVADRATFVRGDMYEADVSKATVLGLFLLPGNMFKLREKFLGMAPGSRIVANEYGVEGWEPDRRETLPGCAFVWCTALLWIVPARVHGSWDVGEDELVLEQEYQMVRGRLGDAPLAGRLRGADISFTAGGARYTGRVDGGLIEGDTTIGDMRVPWRATRR